SLSADDHDEGDFSNANTAESLCGATRSRFLVSRCEAPISSPAKYARAKPREHDQRPTTGVAVSGSGAGEREVDGARRGLLPADRLAYGANHDRKRLHGIEPRQPVPWNIMARTHGF